MREAALKKVYEKYYIRRVANQHVEMFIRLFKWSFEEALEDWLEDNDWKGLL